MIDLFSIAQVDSIPMRSIASIIEAFIRKQLSIKFSASEKSSISLGSGKKYSLVFQIQSSWRGDRPIHES